MAFGYDDKQLAKAKAGPKHLGRRLLIGVIVLVVLVAAGLLAANHLLATPASMERIVSGLAEDTPVEVTVASVEVHRDGGLFSPSTWRAEFTGFEVKSKVATGPSVRAENVVISVSDLTRAWTAGTHSFGKVTVDGLRVDLPTQPEMREWTMDKTRPAWSVGLLEIGSADVHVAADGPRLSASAKGIAGTLKDLEYDTGTRILSGTGTLDAETLQIGSVAITKPHAERIVAKVSTIGFEGTMGLFDATIPVRGQLQRVHQGGDVGIVLEVTGLPVERFVEATAGEPGPLRALVDGRITVKAGGEIPRGGAEVVLEGTFNGSRVHLDDERMTKTLLKMVPTTRLDEESGEVTLGALKGAVNSPQDPSTLPRGTTPDPPPRPSRPQTAPHSAIGERLRGLPEAREGCHLGARRRGSRRGAPRDRRGADPPGTRSAGGT
ncbi:MAG: hypothetical protein JRJ84_26110 [Deltaproteobacteria bacterium]|nr:hypothetical protein [Deltaproteobacteria bacterium]